MKEVRLEPGGRRRRAAHRARGAAAEVKTSALADPFRLVLDFYRPRSRRRPRRPAGVRRSARSCSTPGTAATTPAPSGPSGLQEKELALDVTRRVARLLEEDLGVKVALTRSTDFFVTLRDRTSYANRQRADLFVSIHANAHRARRRTGSRPTSSRPRRRTAPRARWRRTRTAWSSSRAAGARGPEDVLLKSILWDLAQSDFQQESSRWPRPSRTR